jgi:peroxiredoxin
VATLSVGDPVPDFSVHRKIGEPMALPELLADGPAVFHFHLFDFTGGPEGG